MYVYGLDIFDGKCYDIPVLIKKKVLFLWKFF